MVVPPAPVRVPSERPFAQSVTSATSVAKDKYDNEMISGAVRRAPGISLKAEKNLRLGDLLRKELRNQSHTMSICQIIDAYFKPDKCSIRYDVAIGCVE